MKKTRVKIISIMCASALSVALFAGCAASNTETGTTEVPTEESAAATETTEAAGQEESIPAASDAITVRVENIDGTTVTAAIGELEQQEMGTPPDGMSNATPDMNSEMSQQSSDGNSENSTPPALPEGADGTVPDGMDGTPPDLLEGTNGEIPEMPQGEDGQPPEPPSGSDGGNPGGGSQFTASGETVTFTVTDQTAITAETADGSEDSSLDAISDGSILEVTLDADNNATSIAIQSTAGAPGEGGFGGSGTVANGTSANTVSEDRPISGETYRSSGDDENALRIDGATVTLDDITVEKTGGESSNTEDGDFYGQNAALLVMDGATATITNTNVTTNAVNGNGIFSYGEGTTVNVSDSTIRTTERNSGGIQTTGGGTMNASNLDVETQGASAAAIRSDRGGGTVTVTGGTYTTNGTGSPAVYSTADITVRDATLTANNSEGVVVEGKNSVTLENCDVTGNMSGTYAEESNENIHNIMIYQSMSGDADVGHASFSATGGSIASQNGDMFYITNTSCTIALSSVDLALNNDVLLNVAGNDSSRGWGTEGANGGQVEFTADAQQMEGSIIVDGISTLDLSMSNGTAFTGTINSDGQQGEVSVTMDAESTWTLTGDSYITSFDGDTSAVTANGFQLYVNGEAVL